MLSGILGFSVSCDITEQPVEYGTPCADFIAKGTIKSKQTNEPIPNLKLIMQYDTTYTDSKGAFTLSSADFPQKQTYVIKIRDTDGTQNRSFQDKDTTVTFSGENFTGGDGHWYEGKEEKSIDIYLDEK